MLKESRSQKMESSITCPTPNRLLNNPERRWDWQGQNSRSDDIPRFLRKLKQAQCLQDSCAYCGVKLLKPFNMWWSAAVLDHVVPQSLCAIRAVSQCKAAIPEQVKFYEWVWDFSNAVLACSGCNGAANRGRVLPTAGQILHFQVAPHPNQT